MPQLPSFSCELKDSATPDAVQTPTSAKYRRNDLSIPVTCENCVVKKCLEEVQLLPLRGSQKDGTRRGYCMDCTHTCYTGQGDLHEDCVM